ncbi:TetR/AcrR family transcriptional regulator [Sphingomonas sp. SUN039]|uniref:TetR/AcrR family transcriptional regulator n=1 Tax=Sphingomonas sp. SUN039 TaxID=2937787 RepID=UPI002164C454|nr:TetR/AcrR family transcriptional regulator [Sphingomonas sp. SUN039]UVO53659.1 TetR/AcrR family transcriptional regulator [Sphingomonas sp. SUN039]
MFDLSQETQVTGLAAFHRQRKADSRERLLAAAVEQFGRSGYSPVSVEDIATVAGVSRMTFYRHFRGKADIATALFDRNVVEAGPDLLRVREIDWRSRGAVHGWLERLFAADHANRMLLRVFVEAAAIEPEFTRQAHAQIDAWIAEIGEAIPAFALDGSNAGDRRRWLEAWLLVYEILDQSNHAALDSGIARDPLMLDVLADRFLAFVVPGMPA